VSVPVAGVSATTRPAPAVRAPARLPGADYDTFQLAVNRRFSSGYLLQASFDYQWRDEFRAAAGESRSPATTSGSSPPSTRSR